MCHFLPAPTVSDEKSSVLHQKKHGEGAVTDEMCLAQFTKFRARDFSLDNAPWSGRPVEIDSDQIETLRKISVIPKWMLFKAVDAVHQGKAFASLDNLSGYYLQF